MGRVIAVSAAVAATMALSACLPVEPGMSSVSAEQNRIRGQNGFAVLSSAPARTVFVAKGAEVVIAPGAGFCVAPESLDVSGAAAFALLSDCAARSASKTTRTFPGVLTVSVSGAPLVEPGSDATEALQGLETFLSGEGGRSLLGRGSGKSRVKVMATRRVGEGLYVLVEDGNNSPLPVLAPRFWRAFVELGGRMAMVTASGFRGVPVGEDEVLAFLVSQVIALKRANNAPASADELQMAERISSEYIVVADAGSAAGRVPVEIEPYGSGDDVAEAAEVETPAAGQAVATLAPTSARAVYQGPTASVQSDAAPGQAGAENQATPAQKPTYRGPGNSTPSAEAESVRTAVYAGPGAQEVVAAPQPAKAAPAAYAGPGASAEPKPAAQPKTEPYGGRTVGDTNAVYRGPSATAE